MDEEESFARLLSASTPTPRPTLYPSSSASASDDPWANPFSTGTTTAGFGVGSTDAWGASTVPSLPPSTSQQRARTRSRSPSPDRGPDPPSVIAAREREVLAAAGGGSAAYTTTTTSSTSAGWGDTGGGFDDPYGAATSGGWSPPATVFHAPSTAAHATSPTRSTGSAASPTSPTRGMYAGAGGASQATSPTSPRGAAASPTAASAGGSRALPAGLIDEDLLAEHDPRASLTRAFVKSARAPVPAPTTAAATSPTAHPTPEKKAYVFKPKPQPTASVTAPTESIAKPVPAPVAALKAATDADPASVPLPESAAGTPSASRPHTPAVVPAAATAAEASAAPTATTTAPEASAPPSEYLAPSSTGVDHVNVSPLDTPAAESDFGFRSLAIGGSGAGSGATSGAGVQNGSPTSRSNGRGWGAIDADETPLSGEGGGGGADPWNENGVSGWGEPGLPDINTTSTDAADDEDDDNENGAAIGTAAAAGDDRGSAVVSPTASSSSRPSPRRPKLSTTPLFQISVSDPTKVGDPVRGHVVYTVHTKTASPHYRRGEFSVLRRFSDFLWLFEALTTNNPGVIVPPVPDKHAFGRFQDQFIETRRVALQRCLGKITAHPILQLDPDLRLFLESDTFALDVKSRRGMPAEGTTSSAGFMSSWTGPRYVETDEWFDQRKVYLDHLEGQLKGLSKSLDVASRARLDMAVSMGEFADSVATLADSDLGAAMCAALGRLADLARRERTVGEDQAKADVSQLLNLAEEYVRFIASVRLAFASRVRAYHSAQAADKEVQRLRKQREKDRAAGKPPASTMHELGEAERRARDAGADFDAQSKLVKAEFARFERERVDEFRRVLTVHLDGQIERQRELVTAWEEYHAMLLKMVTRAQAHQQAQVQAAEAQAQQAQ